MTIIEGIQEAIRLRGYYVSGREGGIPHKVGHIIRGMEFDGGGPGCPIDPGGIAQPLCVIAITDEQDWREQIRLVHGISNPPRWMQDTQFYRVTTD